MFKKMKWMLSNIFYKIYGLCYNDSEWIICKVGDVTFARQGMIHCNNIMEFIKGKYVAYCYIDDKRLMWEDNRYKNFPIVKLANDLLSMAKEKIQ